MKMKKCAILMLGGSFLPLGFIKMIFTCLLRDASRRWRIWVACGLARKEKYSKYGGKSAAAPTARYSHNNQTRRAARANNTTNVQRGCATKQAQKA